MLYGLITVSIIALLLMSYLIYDKVYNKKKTSQKLLMEDNSENDNTTKDLSMNIIALEKQIKDFNAILDKNIVNLDNSDIPSTYSINQKLEKILKTYNDKIQDIKAKLNQVNDALEKEKKKEPIIKEVKKEKQVVKLNLSQEEFEETLEFNSQFLETSTIIRDLVKSKVQQIKKEPVNGFMVNGLIAAGPRKAKDDETNADLGEDTCGFIEMGDWIYTWVLDGESDSASIYDEKGKILFNSRTLAQDMGSELLNTISVSHKEIVEKENLWTIYETAIRNVENKWNSILKQSRIDLLDENAYYGSTLILACLNKKTNKMYALRLGDSLLMSFDKDDKFLKEGGVFSNKQKKSAFYICYNTGVFNLIRLEEKDYQLGEVHNVRSMILFSDGLYTTRHELDAIKEIKSQPHWLDDFKHKKFDRDDKVLLTVDIINS